MQITSITPLAPRSGAGSTIALAFFNIAVTPDVTLMNYKLRQRSDGSFTISPPKAFGVATAHLSPKLTADIAKTAVAAYGSLGASGSHARN